MVLGFIIFSANVLVLSAVRERTIAFPTLKANNLVVCGYDNLASQNKLNMIDGIHFKVKENVSFARCNTNLPLARYVAIDVNSLSSKNYPATLEYLNNNVVVAQSEVILEEGNHYFQLQRKVFYNKLSFISHKNQYEIMGLNSISTSTAIPVPKKEAIMAMLLTLALLNIRYLKSVLGKILAVADLNVLRIEIQRFIKSNTTAIAFSTLISISTFGYFLTHFTLSLDEEIKLAGPKDMGWVGYGRFGNHFLDKLLVRNSFTPFLTDFLAVLSLLVASYFLYMILSRNLRISQSNKTWSLVIFSGMFISFPYVIGDYMAFGVYNFWLGLGYIASSLSFFLVSEAYVKSHLGRWLLSVGLLTFSISIYQSFTVVFSLILVAMLLIDVINGEINYRTYLRQKIVQMAVLPGAFVLYSILNWYFQRTITPAYGYINSMVGWGRGHSVGEVFGTVLQSVVQVFNGSIYFPTILILPTSILFILIITSYSLSNYRTFHFLLVVSLSLITVGMPFALEFLLGSPLPPRSLQALPLFMAFAWLLIINFVETKRFNRATLYVISTFFIFIQVQNMNNLFYGDYIRFNSDIALAQSIMTSIEATGLDYRESQIVFIGSRPPASSDFISTVNSGGRSFFDDASQPYRMAYFLQTQGYRVEPTGLSTDMKIQSEAARMKIWPMANSIKKVNDIIIVKLS